MQRRVASDPSPNGSVVSSRCAWSQMRRALARVSANGAVMARRIAASLNRRSAPCRRDGSVHCGLRGRRSLLSRSTFLADNQFCVGTRVGNDAAADLASSGTADDHCVAAIEGPLDALTPAGSRLLPEASAFSAPASISMAPLASSVPAIQRLRAETGSVGAINQVQAAPSVSALQWVHYFARGDDHVGARRERDLRCFDLGHHAALDSSLPASPAMASISGVIWVITSRRWAVASLPGGAV